MKIYGLTGNIGTGKSTVAKLLKKLGANIIDADQIARDIVRPSEPAWKEIVDYFGESILNEDSSINRKALGEIVFQNKTELEKLNNKTHPYILNEIKKKLSESAKSGDKISIIEAALLKKENKLGKILDGVITVTANTEKQIERIVKRDKITENEALSRIKSQVSGFEKAKDADFIINNNSTLDELGKEVSILWNRINTT